jgi:hypothetical protein
MAALSDIDHLFGTDPGETPTGDLNLVSGAARTLQRVIRRLMTAPTTSRGSAYPWHPGYGVGLPQTIGNAVDARSIQALVMSQILAEPSVARVPLPSVSVTMLATGVTTIDIAYADTSGTPQQFSFNVGG